VRPVRGRLFVSANALTMNWLVPTDHPRDLSPNHHMKSIPRIALLATVISAWLVTVPRTSAQLGDSITQHLSANGQLTFAVVPGYTNYTVEWAPTVNGPWSDSWEQLRKIAPAGAAHTVQVPMFYRIRALGTLISVPPGMAYLAAGEFLMGDPFAIAADAQPVRPVTVSAFFADRTEVSGALWNTVYQWALLHGYDFRSAGFAVATNHPVSDIGWYDAVKWCNARSEMERLGPVYFTDSSHATVYRAGELDLAGDCVDWIGHGYRLPTEAEWEKAARGALDGQQYPWPSGDSAYATQITGDQANFWNSGDPYDNASTPVGFYDGHQSVAGQDMANDFGLYDLAGNVTEMCWDHYAAYASGAQTDPRGPATGDRRVARGGSWYDGPSELRCAARKPFAPPLGGAERGFRCVRSGPFLSGLRSGHEQRDVQCPTTLNGQQSASSDVER